MHTHIQIYIAPKNGENESEAPKSDTKTRGQRLCEASVVAEGGGAFARRGGGGGGASPKERRVSAAGDVDGGAGPRHAALQLGGARLALQLPVQRARGRDGRDADVVLLGQRGRGGDGQDNNSKAKPRPRCLSGSVR